MKPRQYRVHAVITIKNSDTGDSVGNRSAVRRLTFFEPENSFQNNIYLYYIKLTCVLGVTEINILKVFAHLPPTSRALKSPGFS